MEHRLTDYLADFGPLLLTSGLCAAGLGFLLDVHDPFSLGFVSAAGGMLGSVLYWTILDQLLERLRAARRARRYRRGRP